MSIWNPGWLLFSVILPLTWGLIVGIFRLLARLFIVFTEFVTGVPGWVNYRTSAYKYAGAACALLGYLYTLPLLAILLALAMGAPLPPAEAFLVPLVIAAVSLAAARALMRRAP